MDKNSNIELSNLSNSKPIITRTDSNSSDTVILRRSRNPGNETAEHFSGKSDGVTFRTSLVDNQGVDNPSFVNDENAINNVNFKIMNEKPFEFESEEFDSIFLGSVIFDNFCYNESCN